MNTATQAPIKVNNNDLPFTECFVNLGSIITPDGGSKMDIQNRMNKARSAFISMNNIWKSSQYSMSIKLKLYNSCVVPVLLYVAECWRMTQQDITKLSTFHTKNLRKILKVFRTELDGVIVEEPTWMVKSCCRVGVAGKTRSSVFARLSCR